MMGMSAIWGTNWAKKSYDVGTAAGVVDEPEAVLVVLIGEA
jgi:hypothetical protein